MMAAEGLPVEVACRVLGVSVSGYYATGVGPCHHVRSATPSSPTPSGSSMPMCGACTALGACTPS